MHPPPDGATTLVTCRERKKSQAPNARSPPIITVQIGYTAHTHTGGLRRTVLRFESWFACLEPSRYIL